MVVFSHPPLAGEVSRAERGTEGCHPHDGGTPLRLAFGQPPPLPGEDKGFAAAVGPLPAIPAVVMPGLARHPAFLRSNEEAGSRLKAGMTVKDGRSLPVPHR